MAKRPGIDQIMSQGKGLGPAYGELQKHIPQLCSWLCDSTYEDGTAKGRVQLQCERKGDRIRLVLKVQDGGVYVEAHHETLTDAILTLELLLGNDDCPWQLDPYPMGTTPKKRK